KEEKVEVAKTIKEEKIHLPDKYEVSVWDDLHDEEVDKLYDKIYRKLRLRCACPHTPGRQHVVSFLKVNQKLILGDLFLSVKGHLYYALISFSRIHKLTSVSTEIPSFFAF
ncbi:MAG: hypothetical protein AB1556_16595, partial [Bacillota bacterium]